MGAVFLYEVTSPTMAWQHNTEFFVIFMDPCEQGSFWQHCHRYTKLFKSAREKL